MKPALIEFSQDDIFFLGNIAAMAVSEGYGERVMSILELIKEVRPLNAAAVLLQAMHYYGCSEVCSALEVLESYDLLKTEINRDEALSFHLLLLQKDGQLERVCRLGRVYLEEGLVESKNAFEAIREITIECELAMGIVDEIPPAN